MSIELLELAADALGPLLDEVVFVGGATVTLWITDPGAPPVRPTKDVDVVVEAATRGAFHDFEARLRERRFSEQARPGRRRGEPDPARPFLEGCDRVGPAETSDRFRRSCLQECIPLTERIRRMLGIR